VVSVFAAEGKYCGQMEVSGDHLSANLCCFQPIPVPPTLLLLGSGLLGLGVLRFRKN
jgi:hypothetical protein